LDQHLLYDPLIFKNKKIIVRKCRKDIKTTQKAWSSGKKTGLESNVYGKEIKTKLQLQQIQCIRKFH
jgi:hypothetical protein